MFKLTITLSDGTSHSFTVKRMPRHYKSWLMQQLPYGTKFQGASFQAGAHLMPTTVGGAVNESQLEALVDRRVMRRLATDRAYLNAEDAEQQQQREDQIEREEWERATKYGGPPSVAAGFLPTDTRER